ncbi:unnamed protein product [Darwinula stevensoni]|uniref:SREBP regulating gene protein n=1 Tax=Darwinula stevensoni TaxID=69355 RepID=A0A7R9A7D0_9CRUS|nr:unnamed protein product [Darwinula stevensoni]CAG0892750.1 unnamed protein product [Darwinula stevensoni]
MEGDVEAHLVLSWLSAVFRILRKHVVLALIFSFSLTYFLLSVYSHKEVPEAMSDSDVVPHWRNGDEILWKLDEAPENGTDAGAEKERLTCRNSVQGRTIIADDRGTLVSRQVSEPCDRLVLPRVFLLPRGYTCARHEVLPSGCCNAELATTRRYVCESCGTNHCCAIYEFCISCCLHPSQKSLLQSLLTKGSERQSLLFASVTDHFELCLAKCRTSSTSVQHENLYRDPSATHCFGLQPPGPAPPAAKL